MKKTYINPKTVVLNIVVANLCTVSTGSADIYSAKTGASGALSREDRSNNWDDEDDY